MSLPRPPIDPTNPIPNQPFESPEVYYLETNQGHLPLGEGLFIRSDGSFSNSPYIYCTPLNTTLPPSEPPFGCNTEVNTTGVTSFYKGWYGCYGVVDFPCVDSSSVTDFSRAWERCHYMRTFPPLNTSNATNFFEAWGTCFSLESFPLIDSSKVTNFGYSWAYSALRSFPKLDMSKGTSFYGTWACCYYLSSFPEVDLSSGEDFTLTWTYCDLISFPDIDISSGTTFETAWGGCYNLAHFPSGMFDSCSATNFTNTWYNCALTQTSVDNILVSLDTAGQSNGFVNLDGGTSASPSSTGLAAKASLQARGWTVLTN